MIGGIFKQGMAAVGWEEKFQAVEVRFDVLEDRLHRRLRGVGSDVEQAIERLRHELSAEVAHVRTDLQWKLAGVRKDARPSLTLNDRVAALEVLLGIKST
ncbi:MAG TPA: hypothetical protein VEJ18_10250 [Planctomycetota bacterium]|nr:hypothetical protein [Planctomycetota bacterium]